MPRDTTNENILHCQVSRQIQDGFQASLSKLTVGEKFYLQCRKKEGVFDPKHFLGDSSDDEDVPIEETMGIVLEDRSPFALKPLKVISVSNQQILLEVTSYIPGQHSANKGLLLQTRKSLYPLDGISWQVDSVLQQEEGQAQHIPVMDLSKYLSPIGTWYCMDPLFY